MPLDESWRDPQTGRTTTNLTRLSRASFFAWVEAMDATNVRFFRDKHRGSILEMISADWDGYTGRVHCSYVLQRKGSGTVTVDYGVLEPLNEMEVIAFAASEP